MDHTAVPILTPKFVGTRVPRVEDPRFLTGRGSYVADVRLPGTLHVAFLRSPHAHARIASIDTAGAATLPGVHLVRTGAEIASACAGIVGQNALECTTPTVQPLLAVDTVRFVGEAVAAVVADSRAVAEDALERIEVDYEEAPAVVDPEEALRGGPAANDAVPDNRSMHGEGTLGEPARGFEQAAHVVAGRYHSGRASAAPMETRGCVASHDWTTGLLRLWTSTQIPHFVRATVAGFLGFPEQRIEVLTPDVGGGFGQKASVFPEELLLCLLAIELDRPVQWIEDRRENLLVGTHAHEQVNEMELAVSAEGRFLALRHRVVADSGAYHMLPWTHLVEAWDSVSILPAGVYDIQDLEYRYTSAVTNKCPIGPYRGVGQVAPQIARESLVDLAARELGLSPFEIRRRNAVATFPYTTCQGTVFEEGSFRESIDALERLVGYEAFLERQRQSRSQGRYLGLGVSAFVEIAGWGTAHLFALDVPLTMHDTSTVRLEPSGKATVTTSITTQGQGLPTGLAQVTADALGISPDDVVVRAAETTNSTWGMGTWGSRGAVVGAGSVLRAADVIRQKLVRTAAHLFEADVEDVELTDGVARLAGVPSRSVPVSELATIIYFDASSRPPDLEPTLEVTAAFDPARPVYSNGAHAAIVEVDAGTGLVRVEKLLAVEDCGTMINPMIVEGQIRGGLAQAVGAVLLEELRYDERGQLLTTTLMDYLLPTASEMVDVEFAHLETPSTLTPGGVKGMGESALISAPAALLNAVNDALSPFGAVLRDTPVTPERILDAIGA